MIVTGVDIHFADELLTHIRSGGHLHNYNGLVAYCSVHFDNCFIIREIRVINDIDGLKVAMPNRKLAIKFACGHKNHFDNKYCSCCGSAATEAQLNDNSIRRHLDVCHPTTAACRRHLTVEVTVAIRAKIERDRNQIMKIK